MKRSALYYSHHRQGATFAEYSGWELPAFFVVKEQEVSQIRQSVGIADTSHFFKFDLKSKTNAASWRLGAGHFLDLSETRSAIDAGIDVTSVYTSLRLVGPRSAEVLGKLTSLNVNSLANMSCAQASLAHVPAIFLHEDIGRLPAFHLLVTRDYAESMWDAILHAGHEFHVCPYGLETLRLLSS